MYTVNDFPLLCADVTEPRIGPWRAEIEADASEPLSGQVVLDLDGIEFKGTVLPGRSGEHGGSVTASVVGGKGGLSKEIRAQNYASGVIRIDTVVKDILRAAGESLSASSNASVLSRQLQKWHREQGVASHALVAVLDAAQATFRINRSGEVWVGVDTYPAATPEHVLTDEDWSAGILTLDCEAPELEPGTTFREQKIEQCIHRLRRNSFTTEAHLTTLRSSLDAFLGRIRSKIDYSRLYDCRVAAQNPDKTLQLVPDSPVMKGKGLDKVPIKHGLPGCEVTVKPGAKVKLGFDGGDPSSPFAGLWETNADFVVIKFDGGTQPMSGMGDLVQCGGPGTIMTLMPLTGIGAPPNNAIVAGIPCYVSFSAVPPTFLPPLVADPLFGFVAAGNEKLLK